jgi:excisionase family DNA binding protein
LASFRSRSDQLTEGDVDPTPQPTLTLTVTQAAELLGLSRNAAYQAIERKELPALRFGRRLVVPRAAIERLLAEATP